MATLIHPERVTGTASSGTFTVSTQRLNGIMRQVNVTPATLTNVYDIKITDSQNFDIYERTSITGCIGDEVALPVHGINTITVTNATIDEVFEIELGIQD